MRSAIVFIFLALAACAGASAQNLPAGFNLGQPIGDHALPVGIAFAHDGRVFVPEKSGRIWVYRNLLDPDPQLFADVSENVHDNWDRGLLGFTLDPRFPEAPYVYVLYAYNGGLFPDSDPVPWMPRWPGCSEGNPFCGVNGGTDYCPNPPGDTDLGGGCVIGGHLSRLELTGADTAGNELVLVEDWYQQFPSHSVGTVMFGPDGYLYASAGDGASFTNADRGQFGNPDWPDQRSPANEGGSLRSLGLEDEANYTDQIWLNGSVIRVDPATGAGAPGNPLAGGTNSPNAQRVIAYGLRNPFRFTFRPGSNGELWLGDVGENAWEEINRIPALGDGAAALQNFGWPCFEGRGHHGGFSVPICTAMYQNGDTGGRTPWSPPWYTYDHSHGSSDVTGLAFYEGSTYPAQYQKSLFFADNSRTVIFNIPFVDANSDGIPDAPADNAAQAFFGGGQATAVQLASGPGGDIFFANINNGGISRIYYCDGCDDQAPSAAIALDAGSTADGAPRTISFTAANSVDPNTGDTLSYDWDLDGNGTFGDASGVTASRFYGGNGSYRVAVRVTDSTNLRDTQRVLVTVTDGKPTIDAGVTLDDGVEETEPGEVLTYTLVVANLGAAAIVGEHVTTLLSPQLENPAWTCAPSAGATCAASGGADIDDLVDLPSAASVTYTITATVGAGASGDVESTATIAAPSGFVDTNPLDDLASDVDAIIADRIFADGFDAQ